MCLRHDTPVGPVCDTWRLLLFLLHQSYSKRLGASAVPATYARKKDTRLCGDVTYPSAITDAATRQLIAYADTLGSCIQVRPTSRASACMRSHATARAHNDRTVISVVNAMRCPLVAVAAVSLPRLCRQPPPAPPVRTCRR